MNVCPQSTYSHLALVDVIPSSKQTGSNAVTGPPSHDGERFELGPLATASIATRPCLISACAVHMPRFHMMKWWIPIPLSTKNQREPVCGRLGCFNEGSRGLPGGMYKIWIIYYIYTHVYRLYTHSMPTGRGWDSVRKMQQNH